MKSFKQKLAIVGAISTVLFSSSSIFAAVCTQNSYSITTTSSGSHTYYVESAKKGEYIQKTCYYTIYTPRTFISCSCGESSTITGSSWDNCPH